MSGFDELGDGFASDEANEEWDATWAAYSSGGQTDADSEQLPVRSVLTLPIGRVEVRGDDPGVELCLVRSSGGLEPISMPAGHDFEGGPSTALTAELRADDVGRIGYEVLNSKGVGVASGILDDSESASEMLDRLVEASIEVDLTQVYLDAACVEVDGCGVLVLAAEERDRTSTVRSLVARGARYLTDSTVALGAGTHTVTGVGRRRLGVDEAATITCANIDLILVVDQKTDSVIGPERLEVLPTVLELAEFINPGSRAHPLAVASLARVVAGAQRYRLHPDAAMTPDGTEGWTAVTAELIADANEHGTVRELVVVSEVGDGGQLIRLDEGAILDGPIDGSRGLDSEEASLAELDFVGGRRSKLVPAAFGLPGCPLDGPLAEMWSSVPAADLPATLPSGVGAELLSRDLITADEQALERLVGAHVQARERARSVQALLEEIVASTGQLSGGPVVFGELVDAVDGALPAHFTDVDRLDLLSPVEDADEFVAALESMGLTREVVTLTSTSLESGLSIELATEGEQPIRVRLYRTLASGPFGVLVDPHEFHSTAVPIRIGRSWCRALHPAHRFIHGCLRFHSLEVDDLGLARSAIQNAPRTDWLVNEMLAMAERWGATATVLSAVAELDKRLPGIPSYLSSIAAGRAAPTKRARRLGRRSR